VPTLARRKGVGVEGHEVRAWVSLLGGGVKK